MKVIISQDPHTQEIIYKCAECNTTLSVYTEGILHHTTTAFDKGTYGLIKSECSNANKSCVKPKLIIDCKEIV